MNKQYGIWSIIGGDDVPPEVKEGWFCESGYWKREGHRLVFANINAAYIWREMRAKKHWANTYCVKEIDDE